MKTEGSKAMERIRAELAELQASQHSGPFRVPDPFSRLGEPWVAVSGRRREEITRF